MKKLESSHLNAEGEVHMVGVSEKPITARRAVATACVRMKRSALALVATGEAAKGDVLAAARIAGIQAAKRTCEIIPLCHPVALTGVKIEIRPEAAGATDTPHDVGVLRVEATVEGVDRTGVEMEALVAASTAALTIYDMLKSVDRAMMITDLCLVEKSGGRSGDWKRS